MAGLIKAELGIEVELKEGKFGEYAVLVNDKIVAKKRLFRFPADEKVVSAVRQALDGAQSQP